MLPIKAFKRISKLQKKLDLEEGERAYLRLPKEEEIIQNIKKVKIYEPNSNNYHFGIEINP